jgi:hypothetical protein
MFTFEEINNYWDTSLTALCDEMTKISEDCKDTEKNKKDACESLELKTFFNDNMVIYGWLHFDVDT